MIFIAFIPFLGFVVDLAVLGIIEQGDLFRSECAKFTCLRSLVMVS